MLMNAFVLYKLHDDATQRKLPKDYSSLDFIAEWMQELLEVEDNAESDSGAASSSDFESDDERQYNQHRRKWWEGERGIAVRMDRQFHGLQHAGNVFLKEVMKEGEQKRCDLRRCCMCCGDRTLYFCEECKVPLCIGHCNKQFHTERKLPSLK